MGDSDLPVLSQSAVESLRGYFLGGNQMNKAEKRVETASHKSDSLASLIVLVVDDDNLVRGVTRRALTRQGYMVLEAGAGKEALAICKEREGHIDLLLTDVVMPEMNGFELANQIKARYPGVPVLYVSGYAEESVVSEQFAKLGAVFLRKPFTLEELVGKVKEMLDC
jgi:two-component system, cell cycle sensor histidine kinase and response regulator CckA